jgi:hypothetical protein
LWQGKKEETGEGKERRRKGRELVRIETLRSALFWGTTQRRVLILYRRFGTMYRSHLQGSRNVGKGLTLDAALYPRRTQISSSSRRKPEIRELEFFFSGFKMTVGKREINFG